MDCNGYEPVTEVISGLYEIDLNGSCSLTNDNYVLMGTLEFSVKLPKYFTSKWSFADLSYEDTNFTFTSLTDMIDKVWKRRNSEKATFRDLQLEYEDENYSNVFDYSVSSILIFLLCCVAIMVSVWCYCRFSKGRQGRQGHDKSYPSVRFEPPRGDPIVRRQAVMKACQEVEDELEQQGRGVFSRPGSRPGSRPSSRPSSLPSRTSLSPRRPPRSRQQLEDEYITLQEAEQILMAHKQDLTQEEFDQASDIEIAESSAGTSGILKSSKSNKIPPKKTPPSDS